MEATMRNDSAGNDPKTIWQNQPKEPSTMTMEKIRQKTQELHAKTRKELLRRISVSLGVVALCGYGIARFDGPVIRAALACAIAWSLAGQYFFNRGMWSATLLGDAPSNTGLESYRREVERRRYLSGRFLLWSLGPVLLALATLIVPLLSLGIRKGMLINMIPFLALVVTWAVSVFVIRMRDQRALRREINDLDDIERANR
jgi:hypothetical protein